MFLEVFHDLFINSTVLYASFGVLFFTFSIYQMLSLFDEAWKIKTTVFIDDDKLVNFDYEASDRHHLFQQPFIEWFVKSFSCMNDVDDDEEDLSNSYMVKISNIRGGQKWNITTYSPFLVSIKRDSS